MKGEELRAILGQTGFSMAEFASAIKRSRWFVQRLCRREERVADRWVVQLALFLERKGLKLEDYYTASIPKGLQGTTSNTAQGLIEPEEESKRGQANRQQSTKSTGQNSGGASAPSITEWRQSIQDTVQRMGRNTSGRKLRMEDSGEDPRGDNKAT